MEHEIFRMNSEIGLAWKPHLCEPVAKLNVNTLNVVICTYNRASKLDKVMHGVMAAEIPPGVQVDIIVVDNNSTDETPRVVERYLASENPSVRYIFEGEQGKSFALNTALKHLTGDMVAFTDDDVVVDSKYFAEICRAMEKHPDFCCFGGKVEAIYPEALPYWLDLEGLMGFLKSAFVDRRDGDEEALYADLAFSHTPSGCNMFFRRQALDENGLFRTDLGPKGRQLGFSEDTEYCRRLIDRGYRFYYVPSVIIYHPIEPERLTRRYLSNWQYQCGKSEALRAGSMPGFRLLGVPRYLFRKVLSHLCAWISSGEPRARFYHQLRLAYNWGQIIGFFQKRA
jgi:glycosyltransferase involved in cell wall biosynthesis